MNVTQAVLARRSTRDFLPDPVPPELVREVLELSSRAPSAGNLQPWHLDVVAGAKLDDLRLHVRALPPVAAGAQYPVYPSNLGEPYRTYCYRVGEALYGRLGIGREDKVGRRAWFARNYEGFGAPLMVFFSIDRNMGALQWGDLGLYLQTAMLLFQERGFATCPQAAWATIGGALEGWLHLPAHRMLAYGLAVGRARPDSPVNHLETERAPLDHFARFHGP
jgi:nitroreductase